MLNLSIGQTQNVKNPAAESLLSQRGIGLARYTTTRLEAVA